ncbi:DUF3732 domain-containing protein [Agrobacterium tumefaciens]|uniref:DUF3732 domain-containing protein n=1 Tax=Agrobacterium tumefaciens TaxID=358 RepID=UPI0015744C7E|nr:DUF3732 domain-containing protein [Agrobacterium tumefaciens]NTE55794.1 DUF3732 domain-containing protein [Agrobacterium tumefaciens]NTE71408.1 DUF3732 domain-containing protein [Agrobacterium tumefaciens]
MNRWNILGIAFYGAEGRRRLIGFDPDKVNVITGASGTGKSAIIEAIDYCLGSSKCDLPFFVRGHAEAVAIHWALGESHLIVGRKIPKAGSGTSRMFVRTGRNLSLPQTEDGLEGPTTRDAAREMIERCFGIAGTDDSSAQGKAEQGRATVRDVTPYLFLSGDVIISKTTLLHDMNRPEKVRDIKATMPYFLGAVNQESVLAARRLRQLEAALGRIERQAKALERSQGLLTQRSMALLSRAAGVGLTSSPSPDASDELLIRQLRNVSNNTQTGIETAGGELELLEDERQQLVIDLQNLREKRRALKRTLQDAAGYETAVSGQAHKLNLIQHLSLEDGKCPVCEAENLAGRAMAEQIRKSLSIVAEEVLSVDVTRPRLADQSGQVEAAILSKSGRLREVEVQIADLLSQFEDSVRSGSLLEERARIVGRIDEFLETTAQDYAVPTTNITALEAEIAQLRDKVDPDAKRERLRDAESLVSNFTTEMLAELPTEVPATGARAVFSATPNLSLIEPQQRSVLALAEIGSDQNYLAIHLSLAFALQKLFETIKAPVPGVLVIDQISRPYYPEGGGEKLLKDMASDSDRQAMQRIVRFLFEETGRRAGLQVILIEHAYLHEDADYVAAVKGRWTPETGEKLIPSDWPARS